MGIALFTIAALTALAAVLMIGGHSAVFSGNQPTPVRTTPTSPLDEAERILARRYARGEITPDEYSRMLAILRR